MNELIFLKLGGSLITEKTKRYTARPDKLLALAREIRAALDELPPFRLVVGHGSGSFGHYAVHDHLSAEAFPPATTGRARTDRQYWAGFAEVWYRVSQLNRIVVETFHEAGLPVFSLAPSAAVTSSGGRIASWDLGPVRAALRSGMLPLIFGDIVLDDKQGGKVLSTEVLMWHLADQLRPQRVLLAGLEGAVWADFPKRISRIEKITPASFAAVSENVGGSHGADVTGGMKSKVEEMLDLVAAVTGLRVTIFSGEEPGNLRRALAGEALGTLITSD